MLAAVVGSSYKSDQKMAAGSCCSVIMYAVRELVADDGRARAGS
jgi:hypothetical protein